MRRGVKRQWGTLIPETAAVPGCRAHAAPVNKLLLGPWLPAASWRWPRRSTTIRVRVVAVGLFLRLLVVVLLLALVVALLIAILASR